MTDFWDTIGTTLTQFLVGMSKIWDWLTNTTIWTTNGMSITPIMIFGVAFVAFIGIIVVKELIF